MEKQVRESNNLDKLFNENFEKKMYIYPDAHKLCEGRCKCQRQEKWVKFPNILETKENDFCPKHNLTFNNELHKLPSGKTVWLGCPACIAKAKGVAHRRHFDVFMQDSGMRLNKEAKEWYKPIHTEKFSADDGYMDTRSLGYKD